MSHTPGPWLASTVVEGAVSAKANPRENLLGIDADGYAIFMNRDDAVIAATAPELFDALTALRSFMWAEGYADQTPAMAQADAAIAKAEGVRP